MILKSGCRKYGHIALGLGADVLRTHPGIRRNEHHPSRMQNAFLVPQMNTKGSSFYQQNFVLTKVLVRWYYASWSRVS